ncbi:hypothetical protein KY325_04045, partial [Candidatus Woesearchaeota archaeon]|nr:hypothetical protein [Candidatus Woesearchaeota archaeon]
MADLDDILGDLDFSSAIDDVNAAQKALDGLSKAMRAIPDETRRAAASMRRAFKASGVVTEINNITDAFAAFKDDAYNLDDVIALVRKFARNSKEASAMLREFGISGRYVYDELRKIDAGMEKASKSTAGLSKGMDILKGNATGLAGAFGVLYASLKHIADQTASYNKEIYNAVRVGNIFGQSTKQMRAGLQQMAKEVGLNERSAAQFYQTWLKVSNGMAPTAKEMVRLVKAIGTEFGNTREDINRVLTDVGKLQRLQIGIDTAFIDDLQAGLVTNISLAEKLAQLRLIDPGNAQDSIQMLMRFKDAANVEPEARQLKTMSDLMAHLRETVEAFVAKNGDKLQRLIQVMVKFVTTLVNALDKIPGPMLEALVAFQGIKIASGGILSAWTKIAPLVKMMPTGTGGGAGGKRDIAVWGDLGPQMAEGLKKAIAESGGSLTGVFKGLASASKSLFAAFTPLIVIVGTVAAALKLAGLGIKTYREEQEKAGQATVASRTVGTGMAGGAMAGGIGAIIAALAGLGPPGIIAAAALGTLAGTIKGVVEASKDNSKAIQDTYVKRLTENDMIRSKNTLTQQEITLAENENRELMRRIRAAKFGEGTFGQVKEFFATEMPAMTLGIKKGLWLVTESVKAIGGFLGKAVSWYAAGYEKIAKVVFGMGGERNENVYAVEEQLIERNKNLAQQMGGIQADMDKNQRSLVEAYAAGNIEAAKEIEAERDSLRKRYDIRALQRKANELRMTEKEFQDIAKSVGEAAAMGAAIDRARELLESEEEREDILVNINRQMVASTEHYKNQRKILDQLYQTQLAMLDAAQLAGNIPGARENLQEALELTEEMGDLARQYALELQTFARATANMSEAQTQEQLAEKMKDLQGQINALEGEGTAEAQRKADALRNQLQQWEQLGNAQDRSRLLATFTAEAEQERAKTARMMAEAERNVGKEFETTLEIQQQQVSLGQAQLDMVKSFMGGIGVTYEMQVQQIGKVRQASETVGQVIEERQNRLLQLQNDRIAAEQELARAQAAFGDGSKEAQAAQNKLQDINGRMNLQNIELMKSQQERVRLVKQELDLTKELRYGYLSAIQSQAMAAGKFSKILFTRDQNLSKMLGLRSDKMRERARLDKADVGAGTFVEGLGGQLANPADVQSARKMMRQGPARFTTRGFEAGGFEHA